MSAPSRRFVLTPEARSDLRDLLSFTEQQWGKIQRREYRRLLWDVFAELARFPHLGRNRPEYGPDTHSFRVQRHVVIYQPTDTELNIVRILHGRRDADSEFEATSE